MAKENDVIEKIEECLMWQTIALKLGWSWSEQIKNDLSAMGQTLRETNVNLRDVSVIFYTRMARMNEDSLHDKITKAFKDWIEENHDEASETYAHLAPKDKKHISMIVKQLEKIREEIDG